MKTVIKHGRKRMKKLFYIASVLMATMFAGCSEDNLETKNPAQPEGKQVTLTISAVTKTPDVNSDAQTRIAYGTTDATWETGDKIFLIKSDGTTIELTLSSGAGTTTGSFVSTDAVVAGTYTPYAVSASSLTKGYVSVAAGEITLDLTAGGGGSLADALEHDILKGDAVVLTDDQATATISGLSNHILSYLRFRFTATTKAISTVGLSSTGGINQTVTIAANGTITGSNPTTDHINVTAGDNGSNVYSGYFAVYGSTATSLVAHAEDADGGKYSRLVSAKDAANYTAGTVYGKSFTLSDAMMTAAATGQLSSQDWHNLGLSVKWAKFNVGSSSEYSYDRNFGNAVNRNECNIPAEWTGWRFPTRAEVQELFYASNRQWVTGSNNGVRFNCNDNYVAMGAGGRARWNDASADYEYGIGSDVYFYIDETQNSDYNNTVRVWTIIGSSGSSLGFSTSNVETRNNYWYNKVAMRLVCDY